MRTYYMNNVVTGAMRGPFTGEEEKEYKYPWVVEDVKDEGWTVRESTPEEVEAFRAKHVNVSPMMTQDAPAKPQLNEQYPPKAHDILTVAAKHMQDRAATYDQPQGERSISKTVAMFNTLTGNTLTDEQGWLFMACLKMVRAQQGGYRADSYEDGAAYFALAGESAAQERKR